MHGTLNAMDRDLRHIKKNCYQVIKVAFYAKVCMEKNIIGKVCAVSVDLTQFFSHTINSIPFM